MKILFIHNKMHNFAGMERIFTSKMNYLATHTNMSVAFMTYEQGNVKLPFELNNNIKYYNCDAEISNREKYSFTKWIPQFIKSKLRFKNILNSIIKDQNPDVIICTTYSFDILDTIIRCAKGNGKKLIIESHVTLSSVLLSSKYKYNKFLYKFFTLYDKYILNLISNANCIVTLTHKDAACFSKYNKNIAVIPNTLTINPIKIRDYNSKNVIAVGRYSFEKGFDLLIKTWAIVVQKHKDWKLSFWGNGDFSEYNYLAQDLKIDNSIIFNHATNDIAEKFADSSIFVLSSRFEGFGLVLTEAMSCGLACVAFDCPYGPSEIIQDNVDGILVKNKDINQLATKICYLIENNNKRKDLGEKAAINVQRYSTDNVMKSWINLLNNL